MTFERANLEEGLRARAERGGTSLLDKLATLTDEEWDELTHRMQKHFQRELDRRGYAIVPKDEQGP
jgi:hypothetical protein